MDLGAMLNASTPSTNMNMEAVSLYRRLSNSSPYASPAQSPVAHKQNLQRENSDSHSESFRTPELPAKEKATPQLSKRKIDQVDGAGSSETDKSPSMTTKKQTTDGDGNARAAAAPAKPMVRAQPGVPYDGSKPIDVLASVVRDSILHYLTENPSTYGKRGLEIEAKLGCITTRTDGQESRCSEVWPICSPYLLHAGFKNIRFESNMTSHQHSSFNKHLNGQVELRDPRSKDYRPFRPEMTYVHKRLTDSFYHPTKQSGISLKPRVTTNDKTGAVVETIAKQSVGQLHIVCPQHPFDIRLSINLEHSIAQPIGQDPTHARKKDRLCYTLPTHQIDLTKVDADGRSTYELEIELTDMENLKKHADAVADGRPNAFDDTIKGFWATVMKLNHMAAEDFR